MKYFYIRVLFCALSFFSLTCLNAQEQSQNSVLVSDSPTTFIDGFSKASKTGKGLAPMTIRLSSSKTLELNLNVKNQEHKTTSFIGSVNQKGDASFSFTYSNGKLDGHIIEKAENKAYRLFTNKANKVLVEETDINAILCIAYEKAKGSSDSQQKSSGKTSKRPPTTLQSRPGAPAVIYLDFDGETVTGTNWVSGGTINAQPSGMSDAQITIAWEIMAEDFSPFNINVVTDRSVFEATPKDHRMMCIFTPTDDAQPDSGGVAFLNSFSWNTDDPAWVYNIFNGKQAGDTGSHEIGHTMGLDHDGRGSTEYYEGHGNWAPIMGFSLNKSIAQWSLGEYTNATNMENDLQVIGGGANNFEYIADDHGSDLNTATAIEADNGGNVDASENTGIIHKRDDIDMFSFLAQAGSATFNFSPHDVHPNLDIQARLLDANGIEVAISNPSGLEATISENLTAGLYFLEVQGIGAGSVDTGYSDYASLGQYSISGQYTVQTPENDIELVSISLEEGSLECGSIAPSVVVRNDGLNTISGFDILYTLNNGNQETQSFTNTLAPQETVTVDISNITLTSVGNSSIEIIAQITNDDLPTNNTIVRNFFANTSGVAAQVNSFETSDDALIAYDEAGDGSVWERGVPNGAVLNAAATGNNAYGTILTGNYPDDKKSFLVTNCYDFSSIQTPVLKFQMAYDIEINYDVLYVEYSLDTGDSWNLLGSRTSQPNWYNSDMVPGTNICENCPGEQWTGTNATMAEYAYDFTANSATETDLTNADNIMFRFVFHTDGFVNEEGVVIDDFVVEGTPVDDDDDDDDGILDVDDNCQLTSNADQLNTDGDSMGDVCDDDDDNDGVLDVDDNCPLTPNADQADADGDGIGDVCEDPNDNDGDGVVNASDNCPDTANADQEDTDGDEIGDVCDNDDDNDLILDAVDNCPLTYNPDQLDTDNDGIGDVCDRDDDEDGVLDVDDNCPLIANPDQEDADNDGIGDVCDSTPEDLDGDGVLNDDDNCPNTSNADQLDSDDDGIGDVCDPDDDNDTILDIVDNCPLEANTDQADSDDDGIGDVCDTSDDGFTLPESNYSFINVPSCEANKGGIEITAVEDYRYQATLSGSAFGISKDFEESVLFEDLDAGMYSVCITVDGEADYVGCFDVTVEPSEAFSVQTAVDYSRLEVTLTLTGSETYEVTLNDETQMVSANEVTLSLTDPVNNLQVSSGRDCDELYEESFAVNPEVAIYPNPVEGDQLTINLEGGVETELVVSLFALRGTRVSSKLYEVIDNQVVVNVSLLAKGIYILNVSTFNKTTTYKIIRN
ncbi:T9SS type A sorting domain-containing protein [Maribacter algarum]|uniref:T9SS type A sorting domain-containing protein n=1 Tax=Maribacter algarum (ex Zhang et al. 2020) TaxID=2578118 RepID=A0A5S3PE07_9FLAO|nr:thrombospondin type 3 repeat-containing protein [Maribacter algarum]TMM52203.1 T9SS type A sorting domain-containing protein [Maribacter algarum]